MRRNYKFGCANGKADSRSDQKLKRIKGAIKQARLLQKDRLEEKLNSGNHPHHRRS